MSLLLPLLVVLAGIIGRALTDKLLAMYGGADAVALYAQLSSLIDLVAGVSLAGIGVALVGVATRAEEGVRFAWLRAALVPSLALSGIAAACAYPLLTHFGASALPDVGRTPVIGAAFVAILSVANTLVMSILVGMKRPGMAALWTVATFLPQLVAVSVGDPENAVRNVLLGQGAIGAASTLAILLRRAPLVDRIEVRKLLRFAPAGVAIGILSPLSMLAARGLIAGAADWQTVAELQVVWKANEWVQASAAGLLYVHYLPRFAAAAGSREFWREIGRAAAMVLPVAAIASAGIAIWLPEIALLLYRDDLVPSRADALLTMVGDWLRVVSWIGLYGLYAVHAARAVTIGEFLSLPLFALLAWLAFPPTDLAEVGKAWVFAYIAYATFNLLALRQHCPIR